MANKQFRALKEIYNPYSPYMPYEARYDIQQQPDINSSIGAIDRKDANLEAEKGEVVVKPDLSGIYSIGGRKHSQGGTPLNLAEGSFIFSNDKDLHINPYEKKVFEFKGGGIVGKLDNTPARVIKREVDLNHYNNSVNIVQDKDNSNDTIAKNSAQLMLQKYQEKLGQVAYVQESKKGFPSGVPDFSQGSAPVYNPDTKSKVEQNTQYMKGGGWAGFENPYTPKMMTYADGGPVDPITGLPIGPTDAYPGGRTRNGRTTPMQLSNSFNYPGGVSSLVNDWKKVGVDLTNTTSQDAQGAMYDWALKNNPGLIKNMWGQYGDTARGRNLPGRLYDFEDLPDDRLSTLRNHYTDGLLGARTFSPQILPRTVNAPAPGAPPTLQTNYPSPETPPNPSLSPNPYNGGTTLPYNPQVPLSPLQKANLLYSGYQAATVPRYNPYRSQINSPLVELNKYNATPALNAAQTAASQAYAANRVGNPYLSGANNQGIYGRSLEAQQQIIGQYANENVGVANQQAMQNNQIQRQDQMFNTEANQRYYDQTQALAQNYNNEKRFATNQTVSMANDYLSKNQALEQMLASQRTYGRTQVGTNPDGSPIYQAKPLYDVNFSGLSPHVYYTGAGSLNGIPYMSNRLYDFRAFSDEMKAAGIDPNSVVGARYYAATKGQPLQQQYSYQPQGGLQPGLFKRGGQLGWMKSLYQNPYAHRG